MDKKPQTKNSLQKFTDIYFNLPPEERSNVVVSVDGNPITWKMAYTHLRARTELGKKIEEQLIQKEII